MTLDTTAVLAAIVLVLLWPIHQELTIRALRHSLRRQRDQLAQHRRAIVQLQGAATQPPTSVGQPMPTVGRTVYRGPHAAQLAISGVAPGRPPLSVGSGVKSQWPPGETGPGEGPGTDQRRPPADRDPTLRLHRPPAVTDVEHVLTQAGRALTATEIATHLGRQPWDLLGDIDRAMAAGRIRTVPGHTAGRTAYQLADTATHRLPHGMSVLPGLVR